MDIYEKLGVRSFINARGMKTRFGGAIMPPAVVEAMVAASRSSVSMTELQDVLGARLAALTGNEAAMITGGAASGIVLAIAAAMTGDDPRKMALLPDTSSLANEVIVHRRLRFDEDCALRHTGARLVELSATGSRALAELESAIGPKTAALFITHESHAIGLSLPDVVAIVRRTAEGRDGRLARPGSKTDLAEARRHLPVIVDAAAALPPSENLRKFTKDQGADLAIFSGGKGLRGPQSTGLVVGSKRLIDAMKPQASPHCLIGRPMKVGKEDMVGLYTAVELLLAVPDHTWPALYAERCRHLETRLRPLRWLTFKLEGSGLTLAWPRSAHALAPEAVSTHLRTGRPAIECSSSPQALHFDLQSLQDGDSERIATRLAEILGA